MIKKKKKKTSCSSPPSVRVMSSPHLALHLLMLYPPIFSLLHWHHPPSTAPSSPSSCVLPLLAHCLSGVNHSISISPRGKSPLLLLTSSGINAGCQRRVGDSELPRVDSQVAWERIQRGRSRYIIYIRVFTSRMDSAQQNITLSGFRESIVSPDYMQCAHKPFYCLSCVCTFLHRLAEKRAESGGKEAWKITFMVWRRRWKSGGKKIHVIKRLVEVD